MYNIDKLVDIGWSFFFQEKNSENAYIRFEQSIIHKEYLEHLFERFKYLVTKTATIKVTKRKKHDSSSYLSYYFTTRQLRAITELHSLFQPEGLER